MKTDLEKIMNLIKDEIPFSLIRFGDGEENILNNIPCKRQGFEYDSGDVRDQKFRLELEKSLNFYGGNRYFVGTNNFNLSIQGTIISPAIFINQNYPSFLNNIKRVLENRIIYLVCNISGDDRKLPFNIENTYYINDSNWRYEEDLHNLILKHIEKEEKSVIVLIAGGPYSNILIHKLWKTNSENTYIDLGSVLDPYLFGQNTRKYHERLKR